MKKNERPFALILICIVLFTLCACGEKSIDQQFLDAFRKGLSARWDVADTGDKSYNAYLKLVSLELDQISTFETASFEDKALEEYAHSYIKAINTQREALEFMNSDASKYDRLWSRGYNERIIYFELIVEEYQVKFPDKYADILTEFKNNVAGAKREIGVQDAIDAMLKTMVIEPNYDSNSKYSYIVTLKNESDYDIPNLSLRFDLYNSKGVLVDTGYCSVPKLLKSGKTAELDFWSDADFTDYDVYYSFYFG